MPQHTGLTASRPGRTDLTVTVTTAATATSLTAATMTVLIQ